MPIGLSKRLKRLESLLADDNRYKDLACQFEVWKNNKPTGIKSPVFGGKYDVWERKYIGDPDPDSVNLLSCSEKQLDLILDNSPRIEGSGGRGSGKSVGSVLKVIRNICELPNEHGQIVSPTFKLTRIIWFKILKRLPLSWVLPGRSGVRFSDREINFINGVSLRFVSSDNPDSLRSWGGSWASVDEEQNVSTEAIDIIWPSLRLTNKPQLWTVGTPKFGTDFYERHFGALKKLEEDKDFSTSILEFSSYENPFIPKEVFEHSKEQMDERRYKQEILAQWIKIDDAKNVFPDFKSDTHGVDINFGKSLRDVTGAVIKKRFNISNKDYIVGVDVNFNSPNIAVIYKVYRRPNENQNLWVAHRIVQSKGHCGTLADQLKKEGFYKSVIISDANANYFKGAKNFFKKAGFAIFHPKKNPRVLDSISDLQVKIKPVKGDPSFFVTLPTCQELSDSLEAVVWNKDGTKIDKSLDIDHVIDAARYPISYFEPAGKITSNRIRGYII